MPRFYGVKARPNWSTSVRVKLVHETGDLGLAIDRGVPRFTARDWLRVGSATVVSVDLADLAKPELRQELAGRGLPGVAEFRAEKFQRS